MIHSKCSLFGLDLSTIRISVENSFVLIVFAIQRCHPLFFALELHFYDPLHTQLYIVAFVKFIYRLLEFIRFSSIILCPCSICLHRRFKDKQRYINQRNFSFFEYISRKMINLSTFVLLFCKKPLIIEIYQVFRLPRAEFELCS